MVDVSDTKGRKGLLDWLNARPEDTRQQDAVTIAHRAAMRVLPFFLHGHSTRSRKDDLTALPVLRASLISGVAAFAPTPEIRKAAHAAANATNAAFAGAADHTGVAAANVANATALAATNVTYAIAAADDAACVAAANATNATAAAWEEIREDAGRIETGYSPINDPLWHDPAKNPIANAWRDTVNSWDAVGTGWAFWIRWYNSALDPAHHGAQNWPMLTEIATQEEAFWQGSDAEVNARIAEVVENLKAPEEGNPARPEQALERNATAVRLQLEALRAFLEQQIANLRGQNDFTEIEGARIQARLTLLLNISATVERMQQACADETDPANALAVIEENLPVVVNDADQLAKEDGEPVVSETIVTMSATIRHLTDNGTPGHLATGIAVFDLLSRSVRGWFRRGKDENP